ncbi:hypothetical protein G7Y89_g10438 [Cudoniella acicularis]|uniref:Uncharacterized protein n=1 Tax=Cudoniella acicularis TaxID=354080 RepID=A0A8H4VZ17_9HELO|nr:hypothetical protein G7Y89_g10438 [Cudoniella acicularis]
MHFPTLLTTIIAATATIVSAIPTSEDVGAKSLQARGCPSGMSVCGRCDGTQCKIAGIEYPCQIGKCTSQSGGGDGKICGYYGAFIGGNGTVEVTKMLEDCCDAGHCTNQVLYPERSKKLLIRNQNLILNFWQQKSLESEDPSTHFGFDKIS